MTTTTLSAGTTTYTAHTTVAVGDVLEFPPNSSATLVMDNKNLIIEGTLRMLPANANVVHLLQFINVDEQLMTGSGAPPPTGMPPRPTASTTDIGLWVLNAGVLDAIGTTKVGWNRTGDSSTWVVGDEMYKTPWGPHPAPTAQTGPWDYSTYAVHTKGGVLQTDVDPWGGVHTQEAFNLTRNVRIEGTPGHNIHVMISTDVPQTLKYGQYRYVGPRRLTGDSNISVKLRGRWGMHLHHLMDEGYNTLIEGWVVRDCPSHAFVPHGTNGVVFRDCIAFNVNEDAYWWDAEVPSDDSHDVLYDHCMVAVLVPIPNYRGFQLAGFTLGAGVPVAGTVNDCVVTGNMGNENAAGYVWPENASRQQAPALWVFTNNVAHNNKRQGIYFWRNESAGHVVENFTAFHNGAAGVRHGAYRNIARYTGLVEFDNPAGLSMLANNAAASTQLGHRFDDIRSDILLFREKVLPMYDHPTVLRDSMFTSVVVDETPTFPQLLVNSPGGIYDFVNCDPLEPSDWTVNVIGPGTRYRIQRADNTAYQITDQGTSVIAPFAFYISTALTQATQGTAYSQQLASALGTGAVTWALRAGSGPLPTGLTLSSAGVVSGTPTAIGTFPIELEATDSAPDEGHIAHRVFSLVVVASTVKTVTPGFIDQSASVFTPTSVTSSLVEDPVITTTSLDTAEVGVPYSFTMAATSGATPYTWSTASTLPAGLFFSSAGVFSGTPTTVGTSSLVILVTDNLVHFDTVTLDLEVTPPVAILSVRPQMLPYVVEPVPVASGSGAPILPVNREVDDIIFLFLQNWPGDAVVPTIPAGFTQMHSPPYKNNENNNGSRVDGYWRRCDGTETSPLSIPERGDHVYAVTMAVRGCPTTGDPWDVLSGGFSNTLSNSLSIPGIATLGDDRLIVFVVTRGNDLDDSAFTPWVNSNLTNLRDDWSDGGLTTGRGGGLAVTTGDKDEAGPVGTTTVGISQSVAKAFMTFSLMPVSVDQTLPDAVQGRPYSFVFEAVNGVPPYSFAPGEVAEVPLGLFLASDGTLSGTSVGSGTFEFTVLAIDSVGASSVVLVTLVVGPPLHRVGRSLSLRGGSRYSSVG